MPEGADRRERASATETCHAREREHPGCHDATRLAALRRFRRFPGSRRASSCPQGWIPAFAGMTRVGLVVMQHLFRGAT
jgi:hypothetical protein